MQLNKLLEEFMITFCVNGEIKYIIFKQRQLQWTISNSQVYSKTAHCVVMIL